jgi:hypothetical protein
MSAGLRWVNAASSFMQPCPKRWIGEHPSGFGEPQGVGASPVRMRVDLLDPGEQLRCLSRIEPSLLSKAAIQTLNVTHRQTLLSTCRGIEAAEPPVVMLRSIRHHEPAVGSLIQAGASLGDGQALGLEQGRCDAVKGRRLRRPAGIEVPGRVA